MSLIKPPEPEILQTMSVKDQKDLMAQWAESALTEMGSRPGSKPGSRQGSRPSSVVIENEKASDDTSGATRRLSLDDDSGAEDKRRKGILKTPDDTQVAEVRSILKQSPPSSDREVRSILKSELPAGGALSDTDQECKPAGILKRESVSVEPETSQDLDQKPSGILKKDSPQHEAKSDVGHGILKRDSIQLDQELIHTTSILKKDGPAHEVKQEMIRGILKKESSFESNTEPEKSVLKKKDGTAAESKMDGHSVLRNKDLDLNSNDKTVESEKDLFRNSLEEVPKATEKGVLKKTSSFELNIEPTEKGVLKKSSELKNVEVKSLKKGVSNEPAQEPEKSGIRKESLDAVTDGGKQVAKSKDTTLLSHKINTKVENVTKKDTSVESKVKGRTKSEDDSVLKTPKPWEKSAKLGSGLSRSKSARTQGRSGDSSTEEESTPEKMSWIKNEAVARRRLRRMEEKVGGVLKHSGTDAEGKPADKTTTQNGQVSPGGETPLESKTPGKVPTSAETTPKTQTPSGEETTPKTQTPSGEEVNLHRPLGLSKSTPDEETPECLEDQSVVKLRENSKSGRPRPHSIAERLNMLKDSQDGWRNKVEEKDMSKFTVEGKLNMAGKSPHPESPFLAKRPGAGTPGKFPLKRAQSSPNLLLKLSSSDEISSDTESDSPCTKVRVHRPDSEGLSEFFGSVKKNVGDDKISVTLDDFDHVFIESNEILQSTRKIKPQRRKAASRNPMKNLAEREDLQEEYEEVRTDVAERELRRIKREQIAGTAHIAQEALAGLASKENFSNISLRKTDSEAPSTPGSTHLPYKDTMLLQIKGRRHCQMRLVEPTAKSINSGDCFLLVAPKKLFIWQGNYSNIIERARAADLAANIYQKRDLGCKATGEPLLILEEKQTTSSAAAKFWEILGGMEDYQDPGPVEEDELFEMYMAESTRIYGVKGEELVLLDSGYLPSHSQLNSNQAFIFDFGSELYVWTGKHLSFQDRKKAMHLAKQHWESGYDYSECNLNPVCPLRIEENGGLPMKSDKRPSWALFAKVNENMETSLFKEKFIDWPDTGKVIGVKKEEDDSEKVEAVLELKPYDVEKMLPLDTSPVNMVLEGSNVGRGQTWTEVYEGLRRQYEILTLGVEVFHIQEYDHLKLDKTSHGQFHEGDTYVIRWNLMISQTGLKNIRTQETRHSLTGRERWAYFFWQGHNSTITEKGASALMTVELDEERGPQVRVTQGKEPPCFLQLFKSHMIIHIGKREDESTNTQGVWRLYIVQSELQDEAFLLEVPCKTENLRSRSSVLLLNVKTGLLHVWHGAKSASHTRQRAREIAKSLEKKCPLEVGLHKGAQIFMNELNEGAEKSDFWTALDTRDRTYNCLLKDHTPQRHSTRLFYMHSVCGEFVAKEVISPTRNHDNICAPFPFVQSDLYNASQPGLFLLDNHYEVYLWQGWWPEETEEAENVRTGSAEARFKVDRRLAIETTLEYCKEKSKDFVPKAWLVYAGLEPMQFTNLFPFWQLQEEANSSNVKEGRTQGEMIALDELLKKLTCTTYTFARLKELTLPEGVDTLKLESYLDDQEFEEKLKMTREEFYALPSWKQHNLKKEVELF